MFAVFRMFFGAIFFVVLFLAIKKSKINRKRILYVVSAILALLISLSLTALPFENLFVTFKSPTAAYEYYNLGKSNIELVVEGKESDFVVDYKNDAYTYLIIPKTEEGWKVGVGTKTKVLLHTFSNDVIVTVFQYKNTNDYYIVLRTTNDNAVTFSDSYNSKFYNLVKPNTILNKSFTTYYAYIPNFNSQYRIMVNGYEIELTKQEK